MSNFTFNPQDFMNFMQNPMRFFMQRKLNVPQNISNDPQAIFQHLLNTGQMKQSTYNELTNFKTQFDRRLSGKN